MTQLVIRLLHCSLCFLEEILLLQWSFKIENQVGSLIFPVSSYSSECLVAQCCFKLYSMCTTTFSVQIRHDGVLLCSTRKHLISHFTLNCAHYQPFSSLQALKDTRFFGGLCTNSIWCHCCIEVSVFRRCRKNIINIMCIISAKGKTWHPLRGLPLIEKCLSSYCISTYNTEHHTLNSQFQTYHLVWHSFYMQTFVTSLLLHFPSNWHHNITALLNFHLASWTQFVDLAHLHHVNQLSAFLFIVSTFKITIPSPILLVFLFSHFLWAHVRLYLH